MATQKKLIFGALVFILSLSFFIQCQFQDTLKLFLVHVDFGSFWIQPIRKANCDDQTIFTETNYENVESVLPKRLHDVPNLCPAQSPFLKVPLAENISIFQGSYHQPYDCTARHRTAIIVPYRNRPAMRDQLLSHLNPILARQQLEYQIITVNQIGENTFNRAKLMNSGVKYLEEQSGVDWDCYIFHDVDLLLENYEGLYKCSTDHPRHLSASIDKYRYKVPWKGITGGVMAFTPEQFKKVNGFSNEYWGWGCEDDDMFVRVVKSCMRLEQAAAKYYPFQMIIHGYEPKYKISSTFRFKMVIHAAERLESDGMSSLTVTLTKATENEHVTVIDADIGVPPNDIESHVLGKYGLHDQKKCSFSAVPFAFLFCALGTAFIALYSVYRHFQTNWGETGYKRLDPELVSLASANSFQHME